MELKTSFDLEGCVILLTGGGGHLGRPISRAILDAGADLVMFGRTPEPLSTACSDLPESLQRRCHTVVGDVIHPPDLTKLREEIGRRFGKLHGLVNNAYSGRVGALETIEADDFRRACEYNLVAPFALFREFQDLLSSSARKRGRASSVVNVGSMYGSVSPDPDLYCDSGRNNPVHYGATKAGLIQMTRYLACHVGAVGIRVNSISPGPFPNVQADPGIPQFFEKLAARVPLKRIGLPHEVAGPVVFLLSDASSYVNGVNLPIDGGWTAW
jgi:NAD(P)-dependent dehydrogenase (short-subunit alcohol dehydrogenase family)